MRSRLPILAILLGGLVLQPALADPGGRWAKGLEDRERPAESRNPRRAEGRMTPSQAAEAAQRQHGGGRVLAVEPAGDGYRVKLLQHGDVRIVFVPAE